MTESELAIEIHEEYQKDAFIKIDFNDLPKVNKEMYLKVAHHVHKLILRGKIEENKAWHNWAKPTEGGHSIGPLYDMAVNNDIKAIKDHAIDRIAQLEKEVISREEHSNSTNKERVI